MVTGVTDQMVREVHIALVLGCKMEVPENVAVTLCCGARGPHAQLEYFSCYHHSACSVNDRRSAMGTSSSFYGAA